MFLTEFRKENGQIIVLPQGFRLSINETSNNVYQIKLLDNQSRSVSNHGVELDQMVEKAIEDLISMKK